MNSPDSKFRVSRRLLLITPGLALVACAVPGSTEVSVLPGEVEATEFQGTPLTPVAEQNTNAVRGIPEIDIDSYRLTVDGLVETPLELSYADLEAYPGGDLLLQMNCVEGWNYMAKWTGPALATILADAGVLPEATVVIFHTADLDEGYTALPLDFLLGNEIMLAMKLNDLTLPPLKGFPIKLAAKAKFGYKWAKWITRIELSADTEYRGFWERSGYSNNADDTGPAFD